MTKTYGTVHKKESMFFRVKVGEMKDSKGKPAYQIDISVGSSSPIIMSEATGKYWTINWDELLALAQAAGIDTKETPP